MGKSKGKKAGIVRNTGARDARGRLLPGTPSINPTGKPKAYAEVVRLAREQTTSAISALSRIMQDSEQPAASRVKAAEVLLDRAWGRAPQFIRLEDDTPGRGIRELTREELLAIANRAVENLHQPEDEGEVVDAEFDDDD